MNEWIEKYKWIGNVEKEYTKSERILRNFLKGNRGVTFNNKINRENDVEKMNSLSGIRTPVFHVTGEDT